MVLKLELLWLVRKIPFKSIDIDVNLNIFLFFLDIIGRQFHRLKFGDRFYYENDGTEATRFTLEQLDEIRHYSFSKLYCRNLGLPKIQKNGFLQADKEGLNPLTPCNELPDIDLKLWQEHIKKY